MKQNYLNFLIIGVSTLLFVMMSCSDEPAMPQQFDRIVSEYDTMDLSRYPNARVGKALSRTSQNNGFWESWQTIYIKKDKVVRTPWNDVSTSSAAYTEMLLDIKYVDGWDLIYYIPFEQLGDDEDCYLVFHNRYTGILKVFYYLDNVQLNNNGFWEIKTSEPSSLFAFNDEYTELASIRNSKVIYMANSTTCSTKGFTKGWNCLQLELAYDPNQSGRMIISAFNRNTSTISLSGNLSAITDGLIYSSTTSPKFTNGVAKLFGKEAANWVKNKIEDRTILGIKPNDIVSGAEALFTGGAAKLLGSVTGLFSKTTNTTQSLQLTTNGTFAMNGDVVSDLTGAISPLNFKIDPNLVGRLGVWGLSSKPTILYSPYATLRQNQSNPNIYSLEYETFSGLSPSAGVMLNPELKPFLKNHSISTKIYSSDKTTSNNAFNVSVGVYGRTLPNRNKVYDGLYETTIGLIADVRFKGPEYGQYLEVGTFNAPIEVYIPNVPNGPEGSIPNFTFSSDYVAIVTVEMTTENGDLATSVHKCIPLYGWNYDLFKDGIYWSLYPNEPIY